MLEHGESVAVHVEVVVRALFDPAQRLQLGQHDRRQAEPVEQLHAAQRVGAADQPTQLDQLPLSRRLGGARGFGAGERRRLGLDLESQAGGEAGGAQQAQRVGGEAALADRAQPAALEVGEAAEGIERLAAAERHRDRADSEVALAEVGLDRLAAQHGDVDLPGAVGGDRAPGGELGRELEGVAAALARHRLCHHRGVSGHGEVEVDHLAAERRVAHRSAGDPDPLSPAGRPPRQADQRRHPQPLRNVHGRHPFRCALSVNRGEKAHRKLILGPAPAGLGRRRRR